jgi:hypothetical protein
LAKRIDSQLISAKHASNLSSDSNGDGGDQEVLLVKGDKSQEEEWILETMKDWRGSSKSTSEFVAHFIASDRNVTVEEAISSVLKRYNSRNYGNEDRQQKDQKEKKQLQREDLLKVDNDFFFKQLNAEFRHEPSQFPLDRQLEPVELLALGSIWYLPADAPKDPGKVKKNRHPSDDTCFLVLLLDMYMIHILE